MTKKTAKEKMPKSTLLRDQYSPEKVLLNWTELMQAIVYMSEAELLAALQVEVKGERRKDFIDRLFRKYNRYRGERELQEYLSE